MYCISCLTTSDYLGTFPQRQILMYIYIFLHFWPSQFLSGGLMHTNLWITFENFKLTLFHCFSYWWFCDIVAPFYRQEAWVPATAIKEISCMGKSWNRTLVPSLTFFASDVPTGLPSLLPPLVLHTHCPLVLLFPTSLTQVPAAPGISRAHSSPNWTISSLLSTQIFLIISPPTQSTYFLFMAVNIKPARLIFHGEPFQRHLEPSKFKEQESWFSACFIIKGFTINIRIWIPPK